jgi:hypothetical protein
MLYAAVVLASGSAVVALPGQRDVALVEAVVLLIAMPLLVVLASALLVPRRFHAHVADASDWVQASGHVAPVEVDRALDSGSKGRRVRAPHGFLPTRPPKTRDLGIVEDDPRGWELKAQTILTLRWVVVFNALSSQRSLIDNEEMGHQRLTTKDWQDIDKMLHPKMVQRHSYGRKRIGDTELVYGKRSLIPTSAEPILSKTVGRSILRDSNGWVNPAYLGPTPSNAARRSSLCVKETLFVVGKLVKLAKRQRRPVWEPELNRAGGGGRTGLPSTLTAVNTLTNLV